MEHQYKANYSELTPEQLVEKIVATPHNEEAAAFLLLNKYDALLHGVYNGVTTSKGWYEDCVDELFIYLRGKDSNWHALSSFQWRSSLGYWLKGVARNNFIATLRKLIEKGATDITIIQNPDDAVKHYDDIEDRIRLLEAVGLLKDDEKFVTIKRLHGFNSNEIAELLNKKWDEQHIVKYNNKGERVVSDAAYVDSKAQKARKHLKIIMNTNK